MLNIEDFIKRLEILFEYYGISASVFADRLTVQRSSLSHLMSGRNKPSLDFIMRITEAFPEADLYWLLNGEGEFPKKEKFPHKTLQPVVAEAPAPAPPLDAVTETPAPVQTAPEMPDLFSASEDVDLKSQSQFTDSSQLHKEPEAEGYSPLKTGTGSENLNEIERIVVFHKNGTFKNYTPG